MSPLLIVFLGFEAAWHVESCTGEVECRFTSDPSQLPQADAVVFHPTVLYRACQMTRPPGQLWVAWSMESKVTIPALTEPAAMEPFDLTMTYERTSDVWVPYISRQLLDELRSPTRPKTAQFPVARVQSNSYDRSGRNHYAAELMKRIKVASYGRVARTVPWPGAAQGGAGTQAKFEVIARHKFTLAFENSIAVDYVTEKFFDPLVAGSVPVYLGAPNIADFAPDGGCFIDVTAFSGPAELAAYLNHLDQNESEYQAYLAWKREGPSERFVQLVAATAARPFCRLARLVATGAGRRAAG